MNDTQRFKTGLFWFTNDLRIEDNPALLLASESTEQLICVYTIDPSWFSPSRYSTKTLGEYRWKFLYQSLLDLKISLERLNQHLNILFENPTQSLSKLIKEHHVDAVFRSQQVGYDEIKQWDFLKDTFPTVKFKETSTHTLFSKDSLPISLDQFNGNFSFSQFRKKVEKIEVPLGTKTPQWLSPAPAFSKRALPDLPNILEDKKEPNFVGGSRAAKKHLLKYFSSRHPSHYKDVRNHLDGWNNSTKFSPWLANGSLSARQIYQTLKQYEKDVEENDSTYWIFFELLWREYFQWLALSNTKHLFMRYGINQRKILTSFYPERFKRWTSGKTPYPLVNACMNQLNQTGYMSNRGRQIVASCFVNELNLDWRYGAAYFEQQLVDYDVAINWGNWQYLAGVGTDPRGQRQFGIAKQTKLYDPSGDFTRYWAGDYQVFKLDSTDAADWPIG